METYMQTHLNPDILRDAAARYGIQASDLRSIGGFENAVYEYDQAGDSYIMRLVHSGHRSLDLVLGELEFIEYLNHNNARVSTVIPSLGGALAEQVRIDATHYFTISVFTKAPGTFVTKEDLTEDFWMMFGTEVARLHQLTKDYVPKHSRMQWYEENFWDLADRVLDSEDQDIRVLLDDVTKTIKTFPMHRDNYGLIHTDLHFHNMYYHKGTLTFFDFDDCAYKHFLSDIAIIIYYYNMRGRNRGTIDDDTYHKRVRDLLDPFLRGYRSILPIKRQLFKELNTFLLLRSIILYIVLVAAGYKTHEDPDTRLAVRLAKEQAIGHRMKLDLDRVLPEWL